MRDDELTELRARVDCRAVLERAGWTLDERESTRGALKYRHGAGRIVIVTHEGRGWFDPVNGGRGDVLALAQHVWGGNLGHARRSLRPLAGIAPLAPSPGCEGQTVPRQASAIWERAALPRPGSQAWRYLSGERFLPTDTLHRAVDAGVLREGIYGTIWGAHRDAAMAVTGWEMRGPNYKGFCKGGRKCLFRIGEARPERVAVAESAIDALSLAAIEGWREGTLYVSTGGGWGPGTDGLLGAVLQSASLLVIATDRGQGGELMAGRLHETALFCGVAAARLLPDGKDWNDQLRRESQPA